MNGSFVNYIRFIIFLVGVFLSMCVYLFIYKLFICIIVMIDYGNCKMFIKRMRKNKIRMFIIRMDFILFCKLLKFIFWVMRVGVDIFRV